MNFLKNLDTEDKMLIGAGILSFGILGFMYWQKKNAERKALQSAQTKELIEETKTPEITENKTTTPTSKTVSINRTLQLKKGSKGAEVKELQRKLGVDDDGIFGKDTEGALYRLKGVKSISLRDFETKPNAPVVKASPIVTTLKIPKVGAKLMAIKDDFNIFNAVRNADGSYTNSGVKGTWTSFKYGEEVGTFRAARTNGYFLIAREGKLYFVNGRNVKSF